MKKRTLTTSPPRLSSAPKYHPYIQLGWPERPFPFDIPGARTSDNEDEVGAVGGMSVRLSSLFLLTSVLALQKLDTPFLGVIFSYHLSGDQEFCQKRTPNSTNPDINPLPMI
jgi:hypothetical protein